MSGTETNLTPDKLGVVALDPDALSISGLHNYEVPGSRAARRRTLPAQYVEQSLPAAVCGGEPMLMALSFIFGPLRSVPMGVRGDRD